MTSSNGEGEEVGKMDEGGVGRSCVWEGEID